MTGMWFSRLFWKMFLAYTGLILLAISVCVFVVSGWQEEELIERIRRRLHDTATMLAVDLAVPLQSGLSESLQDKLRNLGERTKTRFTLVASDGQVIADSEQRSLADLAAMENHLNRPEFVEALQKGEGLSRRISPTLGIPFLYLALAVQQEGENIGYVRTAQPISSIEEQVSAIRSLIWTVGLLVGFFSLAISYWLTIRIVRPVQSLTDAAENIASGNYDQRIDVSLGGELGALARSFEHMNRELGSREQLLRESVQRQTTVLSGMIEGVIAVDGDSHILFANLAAGKILEFDPSEVEGRSLLEVVRSHELHKIVGQALQQEQLCRGEMQWQRSSLLTLDIHATPLPGNPCPGVVIVLHDITELKRLEGLRQQFVANVSHELKTPLSSIKAYTETLLNGAIEDEENAKHFLSRIDDQADRLYDLILDMLSLARIETGTATLDVSNVSLSKVAKLCISDNEPRAVARQVILQNEILDPDLRVRGDEEAMQQILGNLLDNAIKYTPAGGKVTLRCFQEPGEVTLEVVDTGIGISEEHHDRLFERFYRVDKARSRRAWGHWFRAGNRKASHSFHGRKCFGRKPAGQRQHLQGMHSGFLKFPCFGYVIRPQSLSEKSA